MIFYIIKKIHQNRTFIKFVLSGGTAAVVDFTLLYILHGLLLFGLRFSASIAFVAAFFVSFYMQKLWTFRDGANKKTPKQMLMFFGVGAINTTINAFSVPYLAEQGVHYLFAQLISAAFLSIGSFLMYKYVIFKKEHKELRKKNLFQKEEFRGRRILIAVSDFLSENVLEMKRVLTAGGDSVKIVSFADDKNNKDEIYKINRKMNLLKRSFEYFYHVYKIFKWADFVYIKISLDNILPVCFVYKLKRVPYVLELNDDYVWKYAVKTLNIEDSLVDFQEKKYGKKIEFLKRYQKWIARGAKKVIVGSVDLKNVLLGWNIKEEKIIIKNNDLQLNLFE